MALTLPGRQALGSLEGSSFDDSFAEKIGCCASGSWHWSWVSQWVDMSSGSPCLRKCFLGAF